MLQTEVSLRTLRLTGKVEISKVEMGFKGPLNHREPQAEREVKHEACHSINLVSVKERYYRVDSLWKIQNQQKQGHSPVDGFLYLFCHMICGQSIWGLVLEKTEKQKREKQMIRVV